MRAPARVLALIGLSVLMTAVAAGTILVTAGGSKPVAEGLTPAQVAEALEAHNAWRLRARVAPLRWAADLSARAQNRAEYLASHGCVIEHGRLPADVGENLFYVSPLRYTEGRRDEVFAVTVTQVVDAWGAESADYSAEHGTCAWDRQCGHYTQIVWATTREVGCGTSVCPTRGQVWVCNYRPRGNVRTLR